MGVFRPRDTHARTDARSGGSTGRSGVCPLVHFQAAPGKNRSRFVFQNANRPSYEHSIFPRCFQCFLRIRFFLGKHGKVSCPEGRFQKTFLARAVPFPENISPPGARFQKTYGGGYPTPSPQTPLPLSTTPPLKAVVQKIPVNNL